MTTLVRTRVRQRVFDVIVTALAAETTVQVLASPPKDLPHRECVWVDQPEGLPRLVGFAGGAASYEDEFEFDVNVSVATPGTSAIVAEDRCSTLVQIIIDALRANPGLTNPTGIDGFGSLQLRELKGPSLFPLDREGTGSDAVLTVGGLAHKLAP